MDILKEYKILNEIEKNENFTVYTICDNNNEYVMKIANKNDEYVIETLKNEVTALTRLSNYKYTPKIKKYELGSNNNYIIYEKINGYSLEEYKTDSIKVKIMIIINITNIVEQINLMNIVHCDLKPSNIMIDMNGKIKILDFGISQIDGNNMFKNYGTLRYSSLEKITNKKIDFHEDIYSIGIILFELINGNVPINNYEEKYKFNTLLVKCNKRGIENRINIIIKKCTTSNIKLRYNDFSELKRDLLELYNTLD